MMAWRIEWRPEADAGLLHLHYRTAARIGLAVRRFAVSGEGNIEYMATGSHDARLRVKGAVALLRFVPSTKTIHVLAILPA
jgi:hypothetical protein